MKELLDAIAASPRDDAPRRVYADALLERGDVLGELINVQLDLTRDDLSLAERIRRRRRERALFREHLARWTAPLAGLVTSPIFRRGFVEEAVVVSQVLAERGDELRRALPMLRAVTIAGIEGAEADSVMQRFEAAITSPIVLSLEGLRFHPSVEPEFDDDGAQLGNYVPVAAAIHRFRYTVPYLTRIVALAPVSCMRDDCERLVRTGLCERLQFLDMHVSSSEAAAVLLNACSDRLRGLRLGNLWASDARGFARHARLEGLVELGVGFLSTQRELRELLEQPALANLIDLDLGETRWETLQALRDLDGLPRLRVLRCHEGRVTQFNVAALLEWPIVQRLELLDLRGMVDAHRHRSELERRFAGVLVTSKSWDPTTAGLGECW